MRRILERLKKVSHKIGLTELALHFAIRRQRHFHKRTMRAHGNGIKADEKTRKLRKQGRQVRAAYQERKANRAHQRAFRRSRKSKWWLARRQALNQHLEKLGDVQDNVIHDRDKWLKEHGVLIRSDDAKGGTPRQRLVAVAKAAAAASASGRRHSFYSQAGAWTVSRAITGEPRGYRSDCSQWVTSVFHSAGLADPNGAGYNGGYTGTLGNHGRSVSRGDLQPGDLILFGYFPHHHVEMYVGGGKTIGHGTAPVDYATPDYIGGPKTYRSYV